MNRYLYYLIAALAVTAVFAVDAQPDPLAEPQFVAVVGDVKLQVSLPYTKGLTLISAINAAGGYEQFGQTVKAYLIRQGKITLYYPKDIFRDPERLDVPLNPSDTVYFVDPIFTRPAS